jgi:hypothetical protein
MPNAWVKAEIWLETAQKRAVQRERVEAETTKQQEKQDADVQHSTFRIYFIHVLVGCGVWKVS